MTQVFFRTPFATAGDLTAVPIPVAGDGSVSFTAGYPIKYSQDPNTSGLRLDRAQMNYLFNVITGNIKQYQTAGSPVFITTSDNGGTPYSYSKWATCLYDNAGTIGLYQSTVDSNTSLPTDTTKWRKLDPYNQLIERTSPAFTGTPTSTTPADPADDTTKIATTAWVNAAIAAATGGGSSDTGMVAFFAANVAGVPFAPSGWVKCNGASYLRTDPEYAPLFAVIGTHFGSVDGTHFNVPDMRGYFPRSWADGGTIDGGRVFGSTQQDDNKAHVHSVDVTTNAQGGGTGPVVTGGSTRNTNSSGGAEARPKNVALLACIKL